MRLYESLRVRNIYESGIFPDSRLSDPEKTGWKPGITGARFALALLSLFVINWGLL